MTSRDYQAQGLTIHWDSSICVHSGVCARALPTVFKPRRRPWITPEGADVDDVTSTIDQCPSKALTYTVEAAPTSVESRPTMSEPTENTSDASGTVEITVTANGWYGVQGPVRIIASDGSLIREGEKFFLCRCGQSNAKPFCDNSHKTCGFEDDGLGKKRDRS